MVNIQYCTELGDHLIDDMVPALDIPEEDSDGFVTSYFMAYNICFG